MFPIAARNEPLTRTVPGVVGQFCAIEVMEDVCGASGAGVGVTGVGVGATGVGVGVTGVGVGATGVVAATTLNVDVVENPLAHSELSVATSALNWQVPTATPVTTPVPAFAPAVKVHAPVGVPNAVIVTWVPDGAVALTTAVDAPTLKSANVVVENTGVLVFSAAALTVATVDSAERALAPTRLAAVTVKV